MSRYRFEIDSVRAHVRSLWIVIGLLSLTIGGLAWGWAMAPSKLTVHIPPDLRQGAVMGVTDIHPANVYGFAVYLFQQLNRWPENGAVDYGAAIVRLSPYLTPRYREQLLADLARKGERGELVNRTRSVEAEPQSPEQAVRALGYGTWQVTLDEHLTETVRGMTVKVARIRYPLRIVRLNVDAELNPWGLALDGFDEPGPERLDDTEGLAE